MVNKMDNLFDSMIENVHVYYWIDNDSPHRRFALIRSNIIRIRSNLVMIRLS
jgi:hypothetical protein